MSLEQLKLPAASPQTCSKEGGLIKMRRSKTAYDNSQDFDRSPTGDAIAEAELALADQEKLLQELIRTDEPTEEATTLLKNLRQKIARALAHRH